RAHGDWLFSAGGEKGNADAASSLVKIGAGSYTGPSDAHRENIGVAARGSVRGTGVVGGGERELAQARWNRRGGGPIKGRSSEVGGRRGRWQIHRSGVVRGYELSWQREAHRGQPHSTGRIFHLDSQG